MSSPLAEPQAVRLQSPLVHGWSDPDCGKFGERCGARAMLIEPLPVWLCRRYVPYIATVCCCMDTSTPHFLSKGIRTAPKSRMEHSILTYVYAAQLGEVHMYVITYIPSYAVGANGAKVKISGSDPQQSSEYPSQDDRCPLEECPSM